MGTHFIRSNSRYKDMLAHRQVGIVSLALGKACYVLVIHGQDKGEAIPKLRRSVDEQMT
jgi:hypothetical protein